MHTPSSRDHIPIARGSRPSRTTPDCCASRPSFQPAQVARYSLHAHTGPTDKEGDGLGRLGAQPLGQTTRPIARTSSGTLGCEPSRGGASRRARVPAPVARRWPPRAPGPRARHRRRRTAPGPEDEPLVTKVEPAPATPGGERHLSDDALPVPRPPARRRPSLAGSVARRRAGRVPRQLASRGPPRPCRPRGRARRPQRRLGQSPGLVGAHDSTEARDSIPLSCCARPPLSDLERRHGVGDADQQDQPFGDEVDDSPGERLHARQRLLGVAPRPSARSRPR